MLEIPEAFTLARQINETIRGKHIKDVVAAVSPHKFAWYFGDPQAYHDLLVGEAIGQANGYGGMVEIKAGDKRILLSDGVGLRYHGPQANRSKKHQLLLEFEDFSALCASVQMYGGISCFQDGVLDNPYYKVAKDKPSPLSEEFNKNYFDHLISSSVVQKLSVKAFLATEQRIPGLGNGVLQDILWKAGIHPKRKVNSLTENNKESLFMSVKTLLEKMTKLGGRDTEKDLFNNKGGYQTVMSRNNLGQPCPECGGLIKKENYLGGSIYFCEQCQQVETNK